jgi:hypothetical protein
MEKALTKIGKIRSVKWKPALCKIKKSAQYKYIIRWLKMENSLGKNGKSDK